MIYFRHLSQKDILALRVIRVEYGLDRRFCRTVVVGRKVSVQCTLYTGKRISQGFPGDRKDRYSVVKFGQVHVLFHHGSRCKERIL